MAFHSGCTGMAECIVANQVVINVYHRKADGVCLNQLLLVMKMTLEFRRRCFLQLLKWRRQTQEEQH